MKSALARSLAPCIPATWKTWNQLTFYEIKFTHSHIHARVVFYTEIHKRAHTHTSIADVEDLKTSEYVMLNLLDVALQTYDDVSNSEMEIGRRQLAAVWMNETNGMEPRRKEKKWEKRQTKNMCKHNLKHCWFSHLHLVVIFFCLPLLSILVPINLKAKNCCWNSFASTRRGKKNFAVNTITI